MVVARATVLGVTADGKKIVAASSSGPSSYSSGGFSVRVPALNMVDQVLFAFITGGYKVGGLSISGNSVTVVVHYYTYSSSSDGPSGEVPNGTDLSAQTVTLVVIGY